MGITQFEFTFQGNRKKFVNEVKKWITTQKGNGYNIKLKSGSLLELHKGSYLGEIFLNKGFTRLEFKAVKESNNNLEICANGYRLRYTYFFIPLKHSLINEKKRFSGARNQGWNEMISLLTFLGVERYTHTFI